MKRKKSKPTLRRLTNFFRNLIIPPYIIKCPRCWACYKYANFHTTMYTEHEGFSPLCEQCYKEISLTERKQWYQDFLLRYWSMSSVKEMPLIMEALDREFDKEFLEWNTH